MARKVNFRAWHEQGRKMLYITDLRFCQTGIKQGIVAGSVPRKYTTYSPTTNFVYPNTAVFMQYTGLKDKNGVEIFEGDIMKVVDSSTGSVGYTFVVEWMRFGYSLQLGLENREVIGNIYENPELLTA